jgi:hypothetical protein
MRRVLRSVVVFFICLVLNSCQHWVGISTNELIKRLGPPVNVVPAGDFSVYTYFDGLGGAPMKFYVDKDGFVRKWDATPVPADVGAADDVVIGPNALPGI